ncbi:MAG: hypothetical protein Q8N03_03825 [Ignavibacteria bacterium]|nr:hypothetical protein [Ignavibacteria bacterium]MDP3830296.1 hypothetical protein [Ignavibacteriaceae bacterium]
MKFSTNYKWLFPHNLSDDDLFSPLATLTFTFISYYNNNKVPINIFYSPTPTKRLLFC